MQNRKITETIADKFYDLQDDSATVIEQMSMKARLDKLWNGMNFHPSSSGVICMVKAEMIWPGETL